MCAQFKLSQVNSEMLNIFFKIKLSTNLVVMKENECECD